MKYKTYFPVVLFLSIALLLPLTWYKDIVMSQSLYRLLDYTGFQVFSIKFPIIYTYVTTLIVLLITVKRKKWLNFASGLISVFIALLIFFPTFMGFPVFSKLFFGRFGFVSIFVILISGLTIFSIQLVKRE